MLLKCIQMKKKKCVPGVYSEGNIELVRRKRPSVCHKGELKVSPLSLLYHISPANSKANKWQ